MLEVPKDAPREYIDREMGMSDCKYRARLKLTKKMIDGGGKARQSIVEGWRVNGKWISELRRSLVEEGIREEEFEEMEMKELLRRL